MEMLAYNISKFSVCPTEAAKTSAHKPSYIAILPRQKRPAHEDD